MFSRQHSVRMFMKEARTSVVNGFLRANRCSSILFMSQNILPFRQQMRRRPIEISVSEIHGIEIVEQANNTRAHAHANKPWGSIKAHSVLCMQRYL